jgi:hypothetical protein
MDARAEPKEMLIGETGTQQQGSFNLSPQSIGVYTRTLRLRSKLVYDFLNRTWSAQPIEEQIRQPHLLPDRFNTAGIVRGYHHRC